MTLTYLSKSNVNILVFSFISHNSLLDPNISCACLIYHKKISDWRLIVTLTYISRSYTTILGFLCMCAYVVNHSNISHKYSDNIIFLVYRIISVVGGHIAWLYNMNLKIYIFKKYILRKIQKYARKNVIQLWNNLCLYDFKFTCSIFIVIYVLLLFSSRHSRIVEEHRQICSEAV